MTTILIHAGRAFTPTTELKDAGILIRDDVIEAIGPRSGMVLPAGAQEIRATDKTAIPGFRGRTHPRCRRPRRHGGD